MASQRQRNQENGNAEEPRNRRDDRARPWQVDQTPPGQIKLFAWNDFATKQATRNGSKRKDQPHPDDNRSRKSDGVPYNYRIDEPVTKTRSAQQRIDNLEVLPNVEDASQQLWNERRQRNDEKRIPGS